MNTLVIKKLSKTVINKNYENYKQYEKIIVESFNSRIKDCTKLFAAFNGAKEIVIKDWNNVTNVYGMFSFCKNLTKVTLPDNWNQITNCSKMFYNCYNLKEVNLPTDWNKVTDISSMFNCCDKLEEVNLPTDWNNVTNISSLFCNCKKLKQIYFPVEKENFNVSWALFGCPKLFVTYKGNLDLYSVARLATSATVTNATENIMLDLF